MRTIIWYISFGLTLLRSIPQLCYVNKLKKQGKLSECEAYIHKVTSSWARGVVKRAGGTVEVYGTENLIEGQAVVFVSNHQGNFDIPILISSINQAKGFIAKIEIKKMPIIRTWMEHIHCIFMDRSNIKSSAQSIIEGVHHLKQGYSLVLFPEGTRSKKENIGSFKAASFKLATKAKVPIIPVTISGSYKMMEANNKITPAHVKVYIHPPIQTQDLSKEALEQLPQKVYEQIKSSLNNTN